MCTACNRVPRREPGLNHQYKLCHINTKAGTVLSATPIQSRYRPNSNTTQSKNRPISNTSTNQNYQAHQPKSVLLIAKPAQTKTNPNDHNQLIPTLSTTLPLITKPAELPHQNVTDSNNSCIMNNLYLSFV